MKKENKEKETSVLCECAPQNVSGWQSQWWRESTGCPHCGDTGWIVEAESPPPRELKLACCN